MAAQHRLSDKLASEQKSDLPTTRLGRSVNQRPIGAPSGTGQRSGPCRLRQQTHLLPSSIRRDTNCANRRQACVPGPVSSENSLSRPARVGRKGCLAFGRKLRRPLLDGGQPPESNAPGFPINRLGGYPPPNRARQQSARAWRVRWLTALRPRRYAHWFESEIAWLRNDRNGANPRTTPLQRRRRACRRSR